MQIWWWKKKVFKIKNWLENLLMVSRSTQASNFRNVQKDADFLTVLLEKFEINELYSLKLQKVPNVINYFNECN